MAHRYSTYDELEAAVTNSTPQDYQAYGTVRLPGVPDYGLSPYKNYDDLEAAVTRMPLLQQPESRNMSRSHLVMADRPEVRLNADDGNITPRKFAAGAVPPTLEDTSSPEDPGHSIRLGSPALLESPLEPKKKDFDEDIKPRVDSWYTEPSNTASYQAPPNALELLLEKVDLDLEGIFQEAVNAQSEAVLSVLEFFQRLNRIEADEIGTFDTLSPREHSKPWEDETESGVVLRSGWSIDHNRKYLAYIDPDPREEPRLGQDAPVTTLTRSNAMRGRRSSPPESEDYRSRRCSAGERELVLSVPARPVFECEETTWIRKGIRTWIRMGDRMETDCCHKFMVQPGVYMSTQAVALSSLMEYPPQERLEKFKRSTILTPKAFRDLEARLKKF